jgi:hypothetical protein
MYILPPKVELPPAILITDPELLSPIVVADPL